MDTIRKGSSGAAVKVWQGIMGVNVDGAFGPQTELATKQWQAAYGLAADGVVGPKTWAKARELGADFPEINTGGSSSSGSTTSVSSPVTTAEIIPSSAILDAWNNMPRWGKWTLGASALLGAASAFMKKK